MHQRADEERVAAIRGGCGRPGSAVGSEGRSVVLVAVVGRWDGRQNGGVVGVHIYTLGCAACGAHRRSRGCSARATASSLARAAAASSWHKRGIGVRGGAACSGCVRQRSHVLWPVPLGWCGRGPQWGGSAPPRLLRWADTEKVRPASTAAAAGPSYRQHTKKDSTMRTV